MLTLYRLLLSSVQGDNLGGHICHVVTVGLATVQLGLHNYISGMQSLQRHTCTHFSCIVDPAPSHDPHTP